MVKLHQENNMDDDGNSTLTPEEAEDAENEIAWIWINLIIIILL
jgi:hypothetical protein